MSKVSDGTKQSTKKLRFTLLSAFLNYIKNSVDPEKVFEYKNNLILKDEFIFHDPEIEHTLNFRCHFYAPRKHIFGKLYDTFCFNMIITWIFTFLIYPPLYYEHFKKFLKLFEK